MIQVDLEKINELKRIENFSRDAMKGLCMDLTHAVYPHDEVYGQYCTLEEYIDCPPEKVYEYLAHTSSLLEWTYSLRDMQATDKPNLYVFKDKVGEHTVCYCETKVNAEAMTVDYHCAWDQGEHLWMIYLMRVVPAQLVLNKPGSMVIWTNCRHPFYDQNPFPETAPPSRPVWVGDLWPMFYAGHWVEMQNLKHILEHRHRNDLPMGPLV
ncbi:MAG: hypothetical protein Q7U28_01940 [Aquabacterium sp.]|nr:hypothetical protein [Aquabacterium sp.]